MKYDFHIHSKYSRDGFMEPGKIVKIAKKVGLSGIALTDHDTLEGALKTKKFETDDFKVIIGSEITTDRGEVIGLFLSEDVMSHSFEEVLEEIKGQDGLVVLPHPFDEIRGNGIQPKISDIPSIDHLEVFNSRCIRQIYNYKAQRFAEEHGINVIAGSDAHFANEVGNAGINIETDNIKEALLQGQVEVFGQKSSFINLGFTKVLKIWRKNFG